MLSIEDYRAFVAQNLISEPICSVARKSTIFPSSVNGDGGGPVDFSIRRQAICSILGGVELRRGAQRRSTIIFLISAIALAGLRPLGQVRVQFMMVWQR